MSSFIYIAFLFCSQNGETFSKMPECYIRGSTITFIRIPDEVIDMVKDDAVQKAKGHGDLKGRGGPRCGRGGNGGKACL